MVDPSQGRPASKVARLIDAYELDGLGVELEALWGGDGDERLSLRDLADLFNRRLLESTLDDAGQSTLSVETTYRRLTDDEVSTGVRTETRNRLEREGIDVESLTADFVTYQAIRSYLTDYRGAEYTPLSDTEKIDNDIDTIQRLLTRTLSVSEERIEQLRDTDRLDIDEFEVLLDVQVLCGSCESQYSVVELLENGGCDCKQE